MHASSLNRADLIVASGQPHGKLFGTGSRLGLECAGEVEAVGSEVADLKAGDRVMASAPGGFAEYAVTDWGRVHRIPANNMTYEQATCFPVALQTMHNAVVTAGRFKLWRNSAGTRRKFRRRPYGHADWQTDGRVAGDRHLDQRATPGAAQRIRLRSRARLWRPEMARTSHLGAGPRLCIDLRWRSFASVHGIGGAEGTASPMWAGYIHLACHGSAGTPPMRKSALYLARRSTRRSFRAS